MEIAVTPALFDAVNAFSFDYFRMKRYKALIFLDMNDGLLPPVKKDSGLLTDSDIDELSRFGAAVRPKIGTINRLSSLSLFDCFFLSDRIHLITSKQVGGAAYSPSSFFLMAERALGLFRNSDARERDLFFEPGASLSAEDGNGENSGGTGEGSAGTDGGEANIQNGAGGGEGAGGFLRYYLPKRSLAYTFLLHTGVMLGETEARPNALVSAVYGSLLKDGGGKNAAGADTGGGTDRPGSANEDDGLFIEGESGMSALLSAPARFLTAPDGFFFHKGDSTSASRLETYFLCPYLHFVKFGLRAREQKSGRLKPVDAGLALHYVAEKFVSGFSEFSLSPETHAERLAVEFFKGSESFETGAAASEAMKRVITAESRRLCRAISDDLNNSYFAPFGTEVRFGADGAFPGIALPCADGAVTLSGVIDRLDVYKNKARVVDYKTGSVSAEFSDLLFGRKIQLFVYMNALRAAGYSPSAALYMPVTNDYKPAGRKKAAYIGWIEDDIRTCAEMDKRLSLENPVSESLDVSIKVPKKTPKAGEKAAERALTDTMSFDKTELAAPDSFGTGLSGEGGAELRAGALLVKSGSFGLWLDYVEKLAKKAVSEIERGYIAPSPLQKAERSPCDWCAMGSLCGRKCEKRTAAGGIKKDFLELLGG
jgi:hypothetical protein